MLDNHIPVDLSTRVAAEDMPPPPAVDPDAPSSTGASGDGRRDREDTLSQDSAAKKPKPPGKAAKGKAGVKAIEAALGE